jgi:hypothetical protein
MRFAVVDPVRLARTRPSTLAIRRSSFVDGGVVRSPRGAGDSAAGAVGGYGVNAVLGVTA